MIRQRWFIYGTSFAMRYLFERRGEGLPMHTHEPAEEHNCIVLKGAIGIVGRNEADGSISDIIRVPAPAIIAQLPRWHELVALQDDTETLHLFLRGMPPHYAQLDEAERDVSFQSGPLARPLETSSEVRLDLPDP